MWWQEIRPKAPSVGWSTTEHHPKGQWEFNNGSALQDLHPSNCYASLTGWTPARSRQSGEMIPVISSEWASVLPGSLAFSLGARQEHNLAPREVFPGTKENPCHICTQWHLGIQMLSCYFGMQRSATFSSAVWKMMHWASSPQIAFLHPPHHKFWILDAPPT